MPTREELRRFVADHRAAQARERAERAGAVPDPQASFRRALALIALARPFLAPRPAYPSAADLAAYDAWARLRRPFVR